MNPEIEILSQAIESKYLVDSLHTSVSKHLLDEHFTLVAANARYYEMFGYEREEYIELFHNRPDLYFADNPTGWKELNDIVLETIKAGKKRYQYVGRMQHKDGRMLWVKLVGTFIDEFVDGYQISYSVMMDISDLMQNKIEKDVTQNIFPGFISKYRVKEDGYEFMEGNHHFHDMFHHKLSFKCNEIPNVVGLDELQDMHEQLRRGEACSFIISPVDQYKKRCYLKVHAECIDWIDKDPIYLLLYTNITDLTLQQQKLEQYNESMHKLAYADEVTNGFNRRKFDMMAAEVLCCAKPNQYSMIWFNMQKFKLINDMKGIKAGDQTLKYIYKQIAEALYDGEYTSRLFSDNFIILLKESQHQNIEKRITDIVKKINSFNDHQELKYYLTFIAGIYHIKDPSLPLITMEDRAHAARESKSFTATALCSFKYYSDDILSVLMQEKEVENGMRDALHKHQFLVYLQPKFSLKSKEIKGAEALIRWNHPTRGFLSPAEFISIFEKNGFIIELDLFVFQQVCKLLNRWKSAGRPLFPISVNMSRAHFTQHDFLCQYIDICKRYDISPQWIDFELTETMVFENPKAFKKIIQIIHDAGFTCSMDDFGSGYSSLNMLKDLELDTVKLDRAFFSSQKMDNQKENIIVDSILNMTNLLHMHTVAEGIETEDQIAFLYQTPCDFVQGYIISRPVPMAEFEEMIFKLYKN